MTMRELLILSFLLMPLAAGCGNRSDANRNPAAVKPAVAVETEIATATTMVEGVEVTGSLEPKFSADVKTQIPGLVTQVYVTEWVRVRKGTPLVRIDVAETEALVKRAEASVESARAGLAQAEVASNRSERELARALKLKESGLATQQSVDDARTDSSAAQARIEAARAQIRVAQEEVRQARARQAKGLVTAPMDGVVSLRAVNVGDLASDAAAASPIFKIVDNRILNLTVTVPSADSAKVKVGQPLEFTVDAIPGKTFAGRVMYINPELSSADRSLKVVAEVGNVPEVLKGGLFAKGRIVIGSRTNIIQIPRQALGAWDTAAGTATVFVVEGDVARLRKVNTGAVNGDQVEISGGIKAGEHFVNRGGFSLKDGDRVEVAKAVK